MQNPSRRSSRLAKKAAAAPSSSTQIPTTTVTPKPQPPSSSSSSAGQANPKPPTTPKPQPPSSSSSSSSSSSAGQYYVKANPNPKTPKPPRNPKPNPTPRNEAMEEKGRSFVWEKASIATKPLILSSEPHDFCLIHQGLLEKKVEPQDDVYAQMPSAMLERRRLNGKDKNHAVFTKNKPEDGAGRIGGLSAARWVQSPSVGVFSLNGIKVGDHTSFTLVFTDKNGTRDGKWKMDLFVSVDCVDQD